MISRLKGASFTAVEVTGNQVASTISAKTSGSYAQRLGPLVNITINLIGCRRPETSYKFKTRRLQIPVEFLGVFPLPPLCHRAS